jgi:hypothetical protein
MFVNLNGLHNSCIIHLAWILTRKNIFFVRKLRYWDDFIVFLRYFHLPFNSHNYVIYNFFSNSGYWYIRVIEETKQEYVDLVAEHILTKARICLMFWNLAPPIVCFWKGSLSNLLYKECWHCCVHCRWAGKPTYILKVRISSTRATCCFMVVVLTPYMINK